VIASCPKHLLPLADRSLEVVRPALLLWPHGLVVAQRVLLELRFVGVHDFTAAVLALDHVLAWVLFWFSPKIF
jgi:hypothetical protein